jgi:hypothetical protein
VHVPRTLITIIAAAAVLPPLALASAGTATAAPATRVAPAHASPSSPVRPGVLTGVAPDAEATPGPSYLCLAGDGCLVDPGLNGIFYTGAEKTYFTFTEEGTVNCTTGHPFNSTAYIGVYCGYPYYLVRVNGGAYCIGNGGDYPVLMAPVAVSCQNTYDQLIVLLPQGNGTYWLVNVGATNDYGDAPYGAEADQDNGPYCGSGGAVWYLEDQPASCSNGWILVG